MGLLRARCRAFDGPPGAAFPCASHRGLGRSSIYPLFAPGQLGRAAGYRPWPGSAEPCAFVTSDSILAHAPGRRAYRKLTDSVRIATPPALGGGVAGWP